MRFGISIFILFLTVQCVMGDENSPITFPQNFDKGVLYFKNGRGSITEDIYISGQSMEAVQQGKVLPYGTVITLVEYFSKDEKGSDGYALKGSLKRYVVMEKRRGFGANRAFEERNREWEYQAFNPDKSIQTSENLNRCFSCHSSQKNNDFVFTLNDIRDYQLK